MKQNSLKIKKGYFKKNYIIAASFVLMVSAGIIATSEFQRRQAVEAIMNAVHESTEVVKKPINFEIKQIKSYAHTTGHKEVTQGGVAGVRELKYAVKIRGDGVELERNQIADNVAIKPVEQIEVIGAKLPNALTKAKSAQIFTDSKGVAHRETYYDLPMNVVMSACGAGGQYTVREDGAKIDKDGYIIVAANYGNYPRCSVVETSMGPGKVYDTGGFAVRHPHGFDLATDWTKADGR